MSTVTSEPPRRVRRDTEPQRLRPAQTTTAGFDRDYWLSHCEGYRVDGSEGRIGFVDSIRNDPDGDAVIVVRAGTLGRRLLLVRTRDVAFVVPRAERIWLASPTNIVGSEAG